jgi:phosphate transport system substrate-binding protein
MLTSIKRISLAAAIFSIGTVYAQEKIVLGGAGSMIPVAQNLAQAYQAKNPGTKIEVLSRSMGSTAGIHELTAGRINVALVARLLRPEEKAKLVIQALGRVPVVFAVNKDVPVTALSESQICDLFTGKIRSWREVGGGDQAVSVLTRNEDDGTKEAVRKNVACFKDLKESADAAVLVRSPAMVSGLRAQPGTIGMTELNTVATAGGAFKALVLDGVAASPETVRSGKYKLVKDYGFATDGAPQGLARRFLEFANSPEAQKILAEDGIVTKAR